MPGGLVDGFSARERTGDSRGRGGVYWSDQGRWGRTHIPTRVSNPIDLAVDAAKTSSNRGRVGGWRTVWVCWWEVVSTKG